MSPGVFVLTILAGGLGAASRFALDGVAKSRLGSVLPWGTVIINLSGSLALGLLTGLCGAHLLSTAGLAALGTGFLGGYTTFSTASYETVRLLQGGRGRAALVNLFGVLICGTAAALLGLTVGAAIG